MIIVGNSNVSSFRQCGLKATTTDTEVDVRWVGALKIDHFFDGNPSGDKVRELFRIDSGWKLLSIGINDIFTLCSEASQGRFQEAIDALFEKYSQVFKELKRNGPFAWLVFPQAVHERSFPNLTEQDVLAIAKTFNKRIEEWCLAEGISVINPLKMILDKDGCPYRSFLQKDSIHLNINAAKIYLEEIASVTGVNLEFLADVAMFEPANEVESFCSLFLGGLSIPYDSLIDSSVFKEKLVFFVESLLAQKGLVLEIDGNTELVDSGLLDSLSLVEVYSYASDLICIDMVFNVNLRELSTINKIVTFLNDHRVVPDSKNNLLTFNDFLASLRWSSTDPAKLHEVLEFDQRISNMSDQLFESFKENFILVNENALCPYGVIYFWFSLVVAKRQDYASAKRLLQLSASNERSFPFNSVRNKYYYDLWEQLGRDVPSGDYAMNYPKITIVTPSYNQGDYIEKTITSVLDQSYPNLEFIVIDGGSTDQTVEILKKYSDRLTYWCSEKDNGQSDAINKGLALSTGEVFNWLCSDDYLEPGALLNVAATYQASPQASGWVGACRWVDSTYTPIWTFYPHSLDFENFAQNFNGKQLSQPSCFLNARVLKEIGGVDQSFTYAMDFDLWMRMLQRGTFAIGSGIWSTYYFHSEAKTVKNKELSCREACRVQNRYGYTHAAEKRLEFYHAGENTFWPLVVPDRMQQDFSSIAHSVNRILQFNTERRKVLFISTNIPAPDNHAADKRICLILQILLANNYDIHFAYLNEDAKDQQYARAFDNRIAFYRITDHNNFQNPEIFLRLIREIDPSSVFITNCWWLQYCLLMTHVLILAEQNRIKARFIVDTMDFHYKHYIRKFNVSHAEEDRKEAENFLVLEDELYSRADCVVVVTEEEKNDILKTLKKPIKSILMVPTIHDITDMELLSKVPMEKRFCNVCFVGNFGAQHNVDAVRFFLREVFPLIQRDFPQTGYPDPEFHIIGINLEPYRREFESAHAKVIGFVEDLQSLLVGDTYKVMVCPLVYGSGIKGKIGDAACAGLPFVTTSIGAEGFPVQDGVDCFIADAPSEFASKCIQLMSDNVVWHNFSIRSRIMVHNNYSQYAVSNKLKEIMGGSAEMIQKTEDNVSRYERIQALKEKGSQQPVDAGSQGRILGLLQQIHALPSDWHKAGTLDVSVLAAFVKHAAHLPLEHSLETGSGKSTLMFSNISRHHLVFALDAGDSITCVKKSPLFNQSAVEYVEGPTQTTLPYYRFHHKLDFALIDGPHGYPFPEMEYYFIYPHLKEGAILVVDDIHIPTIFNLFKFLMDDTMFEFLEIVNQTTAFFRRTSAPLFSPTGDGWWEQEYNKKNFPESMLNDELRKLLGR